MKTALAEYGMHKSHKKHVRKNKADFILKDISDILKIVR
jgi:hypothetical protein